MVFDKFNNSSLLWITLINKAYIEFTNNFLKSIELRNIRFDNFVIFCADEDSFNEFKDKCCCIRINEVLNKYISSELGHWDHIHYKQIVFTKLDVLLYTLKNTHTLNVQHVGYIDMDIVLFYDPTTVMMEHIQNYPETQIFCQCDENPNNLQGPLHGYYTCSDVTSCTQICTGIISVKNDPDLYHLFHYTESDVENFCTDQQFLQQKVNNYNISYRTIDRLVLVNGCYPNSRFERMSPLPQTCAVHFNYLFNYEKKDFMIMHGMWYL